MTSTPCPLDPRRRCLTLIELMVVVTLMSIAVGTATVNLHGLSRTGRLRAAGTQIATLWQLGSQSATASGMPQLLEIDKRRCRLRMPRYIESQWAWGDPIDRILVGRARIESVLVNGTVRQADNEDGRWRIALPPDGSATTYGFVLALPCGLRGRLQIDGVTGADSFELAGEDDW